MLLNGYHLKDKKGTNVPLSTLKGCKETKKISLYKDFLVFRDLHIRINLEIATFNKKT